MDRDIIMILSIMLHVVLSRGKLRQFVTEIHILYRKLIYYVMLTSYVL